MAVQRGMPYGSITDMSLSLLFWVLYILTIVFSIIGNLPLNAGNAKPTVITIVILVLIGLLGWAEFGAAIHR